MPPPEAPVDKTGNTPPAVSLCVQTLRKRPEFLALNRARRQGTGSMLVQGRDRGDGCAMVRVGFTCSKKVGNAVARNRAKRRLREVARLLLPEHGREGWDYALIGRHEVTAARDFEDLQRDFLYALRKLHGG
ncbi:MAG: ribonuclease P protein component [Roseovarius sp.]